MGAARTGSLVVNQLSFDGTEVAHPPRAPRPLTQRQLGVLTALRACGVLAPGDFGPGGYGVLRRPERRGLVDHIGHGRWRARPRTEHWS